MGAVGKLWMISSPGDPTVGAGRFAPQTVSTTRSLVVGLHGLAALSLVVACTGLSIYALLRAHREWRDLEKNAGTVGAWVVVAALAASLLAQTAAVRRILRVRSAGYSTAGWRRLFCFAVAGWLGYAAFFPVLHQLTFEVYWGVAAGAFAIGVCRQRTSSSRTKRLVECVVWNFCWTALGLEAALRCVAVVSASPLFSMTDAEAADNIARFRFPAGSQMYGYAFNSAGCYDEPFENKKSGLRRLAVVSDSFGVGVVPHPLHFTTICEKVLSNADVLNMGIAGIGPQEYEHLIRTEVPSLHADAVVVCLFVGNDVLEVKVEPKRLAWLRSWFERDRLVSVVLFHRLSRLATHWRGGAYWPAPPPCEHPADDTSLEKQFPWLVDPNLELPSLSEEMYLSIETHRAIAVCGPDRRRYAHLFAALERIILAADPIPIAFCLIPDEFQIENDLWNAVQARAPATLLDRDQPQRLITDWLRTNKIACLDLLPILRGVKSTHNDGRRLYHRQDTHFNSLGNKVAGESLAKFAELELDWKR